MQNKCWGRKYKQKIYSEKNLKQLQDRFYIKDIKKGDKITKHIRSIRPGTGLPLEHYEKVIGKKIKDRFRGQPVQKKIFNFCIFGSDGLLGKHFLSELKKRMFLRWQEEIQIIILI